MAKISKLNLNGSIYDIGSKAANVLFDDNKSVDETRVQSVAFTEEATGVKLELKDKDGGALCSDSIDLAKIDKAGVVVIDSEMKKDAATKKVTSTNSPTSKAVADYIESELGDLAGAMVFKGGVSSTAALPTACKAGDTYIVQEEGTYAGKTLKVGDMLIANKDKESGAAAADWTPVSPTPKVENKQATIGTDETTIAIVDGKEITLKNEFDDELDEDSENAVQNKVVKEELEKKAEIVEIATSAGAAKLTLAAIKDLKNPQFQYQGKDIQAIKISTTECLWEGIDEEGWLWQYKQTSSGLTATKKQIALMNNKDGQTKDSKHFYTDFVNAGYGTNGGVYFNDFSDEASTDNSKASICVKEDTKDNKDTIYVQRKGGQDIKITGVDDPIEATGVANKRYVDRNELWKAGTASPYDCKLTNADLFKDVNSNRRYMFKGIDVSYKSAPTATKAEFFYIDGNEEHTLVVENNKITDTVEKLAQLNEIDVLKTGQEQKLVIKMVDSNDGFVAWNVGTYYDKADKKVKTYVNGSTDPMVLAPELKLSETPSPNVIYLDSPTKKLYQWNPTTATMDQIPTGTGMVNILYADLVELRDNKKLEPGTVYRITDFVTTADGSNPLGKAATSALHPFDVVVTALNDSTLDENATAMLHDGDTYFANSNITAWNIKYCLDNDASRFAWANVSGKGVIFYMKDERGNEAGYDFKNILQDGKFTFGKTTDDSLGGGAVENKIHPSNSNGLNVLPDVIMDLGCQLNDVGAFSMGVSIGNSGSGNKIGDLNMMLDINGGYNTIMNQCSNITIDDLSSSENYIGSLCSDIVLTSECIGNRFGQGCNVIKIERGHNNVFGENCSGLIFGEEFNNNTFGNNVTTQISDFDSAEDALIYGKNIQNCKFGNEIHDLFFYEPDSTTALDYLDNIQVESGQYDVKIYANQWIHDGSPLSNIVIHTNLNGEEITLLDEWDEFYTNSDHQLHIGKNTYNYVKQWVEADTINLEKITYDELVKLRDDEKLIPGMQYRITDFTTSTFQEGTSSAGHPFDIIVTATSNKTLSEDAKAIQNDDDMSEYFNEQNLGAWELKYSLDASENYAWSPYDVDPDEKYKKLNCIKATWSWGDPEYFVYYPGFADEHGWLGVSHYLYFVKLDNGEIGNWNKDRYLKIYEDDAEGLQPGDRVDSNFGTYTVNAVWHEPPKVISQYFKLRWTGTDDPDDDFYVIKLDPNVPEYYWIPSLDEIENADEDPRFYIDNDDIVDIDDIVTDYFGDDYKIIDYGDIALPNMDDSGEKLPFKGIIYYMKDEYGNEAGYDFKNILFTHDFTAELPFDDFDRTFIIKNTPTFTFIENNTEDASMPFRKEVDLGEYEELPALARNNKIEFQRELPFNIIVIHDENPALTQYNKICGGSTVNVINGSYNTIDCTENAICGKHNKLYNNSNQNQLRCNNAELNDSSENIIVYGYDGDAEFRWCKLDHANANYIASPCVITGADENSIPTNCNNITIYPGAHGNTLDRYIDNVVINSGSTDNRIKVHCKNVTIGSNSNNNELAEYCTNVTIGNDCNNNYVTQGCNGITFGNNCSDCGFKNPRVDNVIFEGENTNVSYEYEDYDGNHPYGTTSRTGNLKFLFGVHDEEITDSKLKTQTEDHTATDNPFVTFYGYDKDGVLSRWTEPEGGSAELKLIEKITCAQLRAKRDANQLVPGMHYQITDYKCTIWWDPNNQARALNHKFDIIIMAINDHELGTNCQVCPHEGETYFNGQNLEAWEVNYVLGNWDGTTHVEDDNVSFEFGVITYMKDNNKNEANFDFKNIQFKRYPITACATIPALVGKSYGPWTSLSGASIDTSSPKWCYIFHDTRDDTDASLQKDFQKNVLNNDVYKPMDIVFFREGMWDTCAYNNITSAVSGVSCFYCQSVTFGGTNAILYNNVRNCNINGSGLFDRCQNVNTGDGSSVKGAVLNSCTIGDDSTNISLTNCNYTTVGDACKNITITGGSTNATKCLHNKIGNKCETITMGQACNGNVLGSYNKNITFGNNCSYNHIGDNCTTTSKFGNNCTNNYIGNGCSFTFSDICSYNTLGSSCRSVILGEECQYNNFENGCNYIDFATLSNRNHVGPNCMQIYLKTGSCEDNYFGPGCSSINLGELSIKNVFESGNMNITAGTMCQFNHFGSNAQALSVGSGFVNNTIGQSCSVKFKNTDNSKVDYIVNCSFGNQVACTIIPPVKPVDNFTKCMNIHVLDGLYYNTADITLDSTVYTPSQTYSMYIGLDKNGNIKQWNPADLVP